MIYRFFDLHLDLGRHELSRDGEVIHLTKLSYQVLLSLVEAAPDLLTHDQLINRAWGENRIVTPENLTQRIKVLRESLGDDAANPVYIEAVRGQGFRLLPDVIEVKQDSGTQSAKGNARRWYAAAAVLLLAIVAGVAFWPEPEHNYEREVDVSAPGSRPSVAVLPFSNLSPETENAFYAAGLHEEVLNHLAKLNHLGVISRTSMLSYADTSLTIPEIARELNVTTVLEGSVRRSGDRVRVTIQLVDGLSDEHLWSETYDRALKNFFEIETDIARNVAQALDRALSADELTRLDQPATNNLQAFSEYVLGNEAKRLRTVNSVQDAVQHFRRAVELDPDYALAWAGLAESLTFQVEYGSLDLESSFAPRQQAIDRALEIDPLMGEAWLALTKLQMAQGLIKDPAAHYLKVIELSPNYAQAYHMYGTLLTHSSRHLEALPYLEKAVALDPSALAQKAKLAQALHGLNRHDESLQLLYQGVEDHPDYPGFYRDLGGILHRLGRVGEAMYWINKGSDLPSGSRYLRYVECSTLAALRAVAEADQCYLKLLHDFPREAFRVQRVNFARPDIDEIEPAFAKIRPTAQPHEWVGMARAYMNQRQWAKARRIMEGWAPAFFSEDPVSLTDSQLYLAVNSAIILYNTGDTDRAQYLFDLALKQLEGVDRLSGPPMRIGDVVIHAVRGDKDAANQALRDVYDSGWRLDVNYLRGPQFDLMTGDSEWESTLAEFYADLDRQLSWYQAHKDEPVSLVLSSTQQTEHSQQ